MSQNIPFVDHGILPDCYQWQDHEVLPPIRTIANIWNPLNTFAYNFRLFFTLFVAGGCYRRNPHRREYFWRASYQQMQHILKAGATIEIEGIRNVKSLGDQPAVFIGNHMSLLETFLLPCLLLPYTDPVFVVKESLKQMIFLGIILQKQNAIAVGRSNPRDDLKAVLEDGQRELANGRSVVIFPQSTRQVMFDPENFSTIAVKLAAKAKVPVIPLALRTDFLQNGSISKDIGSINPARPHIHFAFGAPIPVSGNGRDTHSLVLDYIREHLKAWGVPIKNDSLPTK